jgi:hypothetical protein
MGTDVINLIKLHMAYFQCRPGPLPFLDLPELSKAIQFGDGKLGNDVDLLVLFRYRLYELCFSNIQLAKRNNLITSC